jgi:hypothetical protein
MGSAAPATVSESATEPQITSNPELHLQAPVNSQLGPQVQAAPQVSQSDQPAAVSAAPIHKLQSAVLQTLMDGNQRILVSMLEAGEWSVEQNEVVVRVSESQTVVDMSVGPDARRLAIASASGVLGRPVKLKIVAGATVTAAEGKRNGAGSAGSTIPLVSGRSRAEQDSVVRRLQEKFGAEIRTVIDYKEKR